MGELDKYLNAKLKSPTRVKNPDKVFLHPPGMEGVQYNGKTIVKSPSEQVGIVSSTKDTKAKGLGTDGYMETAGKNQVVCFYMPRLGDSYTYHVRFFTQKGNMSGPYTYSKDDIIYAGDENQTVEAAVKLHEKGAEKRAEENKKKFTAEIERVNKSLEPVTSAFNKINFLQLATHTFNTQRTLMQMVCSNDNGGLYKYNHYYGEGVEVVISNEKDCGDFLLYLPVQWVSAVGYTGDRVQRWIDYINNLGIDVPVEYLGISPREQFKEYPSLRDFQTGNFDASNVINKNEFYLVKINACECGAINYFIYKLIVSLYHSWTKWIPGLTMQIKEELEDDISEWDALLIALNTDTNSSIVEVRQSNNKRPSYIKLFSKKNSVHSYLSKLSSTKMRTGQAFHYEEVTVEKATKIDHAFGSKDFRTVFDIFSKLKSESLF